MADRVTLVLEKNRVHRMKVDRDDLISKSDYFASLLSLSFDDSENLEHRINYDIDVDTLRVSSRHGDSRFYIHHTIPISHLYTYTYF